MTTTHPWDMQVDLVVNDPGDVTELQKMEDELTVRPEDVSNSTFFKEVEGIVVPNLPEYKIGPGDVIEIVYHMHYERDPDEYKIEVQDKLSVNFPYQPQFNTTVLVRSDGRITLPIIGEMVVESMTPDNLSKELNQQYGKYIRNPNITVALEEFNVKVEELKKSITTAPRGQSKIAPVTPDGSVYFPIIGQQQAGGFTVRQLEKVVNRKYGDYIRNLQTTIILLEIQHSRCYVLGEVNRPGSYPMDSEFNLLDAIAEAGGFTGAAHLEEVLVIRYEGLRRPLVFKVDVDDALESGVAFHGMNLRSSDIVYVPKTYLDNLNELIAKIFTKGIYAIAPFQSNFNVNYDLPSYSYTITREDN